MSFEDNLFNSPLDQGQPLWAGEVDYSTPYPTSALDSGGGSLSSWEKLFQGSIGKGLDYFMAKDAAITRANLPGSYPRTYVRGADGRLYQSNGGVMMPVGAPQAASGNTMLLLLIVGAVLLLKKG